MYEKLIKRLRKCTAEQNGEKTLWHQAADAIEDLQKQLEESYNSGYTHGLDDAAEVDLVKKMSYWWIPVTERLPKIDKKHHCSKDVLAYLKDGRMCFTALEKNISGQTRFECERHPAFKEEMIVTHWMPLPKPPKADKDGAE